MTSQSSPNHVDAISTSAAPGCYTTAAQNLHDQIMSSVDPLMLAHFSLTPLLTGVPSSAHRDGWVVTHLCCATHVQVVANVQVYCPVSVWDDWHGPLWQSNLICEGTAPHHPRVRCSFHNT
jgi:hypothetical protein